jgi:hypothetical protein
VGELDRHARGELFKLLESGDGRRRITTLLLYLSEEFRQGDPESLYGA